MVGGLGKGVDGRGEVLHDCNHFLLFDLIWRQLGKGKQCVNAFGDALHGGIDVLEQRGR